MWFSSTNALPTFFLPLGFANLVSELEMPRQLGSGGLKAASSPQPFKP
jgi:hypothetical protein